MDLNARVNLKVCYGCGLFINGHCDIILVIVFSF